MNATDDTDFPEPVGEAPELPAAQLGIAAARATTNWLEHILKWPENPFKDNVFGSPIQDRRAGAIAEIRALHAPQTIDVKCCPVDCEDHEDPDDCPDVKLDVCGHCYGLAEEANEYYGEEEGIALQFIYPCETALALAKWGV